MTIEDYQSSTHLNTKDAKVQSIDLPVANVLKYILEDGSWFALRPSGIEPKVKIYMSVVTDNANQAADRLAKIEADILARVDQVLKEKRMS